MIYGYARVSKTDQNLNLQLDSIKKYGVDKIYKEKTSGNMKKPVLETLLNKIQTGDKLVIWRLDRLGRRAVELMTLSETFMEKNISLVSITEHFDSSSIFGKFMFNMICCFAEMERNVISERTKAGLLSARERGKFGGRPRGISDKAQKKIESAVDLYTQYLEKNEYTVPEMCKKIGVSKATFYKYIKHGGIQI